MDTISENHPTKDDQPVFLDDLKSRDILNALLEYIPTFTYSSTFTEKSLLSLANDDL